MTLLEMEGFLRGKCIPRDMLVNETNAQYLVRKFSGLERQRDALVAENVVLKIANGKLVKEQQAAWPIGLLDSFISEHSPETPATDAVLREIGAKAVDECAETLLANDDISVDYEYQAIKAFAQQLREGKV